MADTTISPYEPSWRDCDECEVRYFIGATLNPRNHKWRPIPLSTYEDAEGNFEIDWHQPLIEVFDRMNESIGLHPVVVYGSGIYRPHNPSHFLPESHGVEGPQQRLHNFRLAMDDDD